jgi:hypothetical protein
MITVSTALTLIIIDAAVVWVRAEKERAAAAGHQGDGDVRAVKAGIAAWEKYRQSRR